MGLGTDLIEFSARPEDHHNYCVTSTRRDQ
jgi:hypothetical protein